MVANHATIPPSIPDPTPVMEWSANHLNPRRTALEKAGLPVQRARVNPRLVTPFTARHAPPSTPAALCWRPKTRDGCDGGNSSTENQRWSRAAAASAGRPRLLSLVRALASRPSGSFFNDPKRGLAGRPAPPKPGSSPIGRHVAFGTRQDPDSGPIVVPALESSSLLKTSGGAIAEFVGPAWRAGVRQGSARRYQLSAYTFLETELKLVYQIDKIRSYSRCGGSSLDVDAENVF